VAKKKKNKDKTTDAPAAASTSAAATSKPDQPIDVAFAAGNYAAVRSMGRKELTEKAKMLLELVKIDRVQVLVGIGAIIVVLLVALMTLK
jgi:hypothetical protein